MKKSLFALSLGFGIAILAQTAEPQTPSCGEREKVTTALADKYGETRRAIGLARNNTIMEIYASNKTGTWTILVTLPNGKSCLIASGSSFEALDEVLQKSSIKI